MRDAQSLQALTTGADPATKRYVHPNTVGVQRQRGRRAAPQGVGVGQSQEEEVKH